MGRDYRKEYDEYHSRPEQRRNNDKRKAARRLMEREGLVEKGDGRDVDHRRPLGKGGGNGRGNLRVMNKSKNRGRDK